MRRVLAALFTSLLVSGVLAGDLKDQLLGKWMYVSIRTSEGSEEIHDGDYVEFLDDEIRWRWKSEDHRHLYRVQRVGGRNLIAGFLPSTPDEPDIYGIFDVKDGVLKICDRDASLGYPASFSVSEGTVLLLKPQGKKKTEQGAAAKP